MAATREHLDLIRSVDHLLMLDQDTVCSSISYDAALLAAGAAIEAVATGAFALVRPPGQPRAAGSRDGLLPVRQRGHRGAACAAGGVGRVAIVDWDVHHGNGTQAIFEDDDSVLFVSLHQWPFYPGGGGPDDQRETTLNVPLPHGGPATPSTPRPSSGSWSLRCRFDPELLLVSAGFDAHESTRSPTCASPPTGSATWRSAA